MDVSSYVLLSHEQALRRRLDVAANNMANTNTVGFRRERPVFREFVERARQAQVRDARNTSFVLDFGAVHDTAPGPFQATGNPLDVMIQGPGYLTVSTPAGVAYTRAGFIKIAADGRLTSSAGYPLLDDRGAPISVPTGEEARVTIGEDGTVHGATGPLGRLGLAVFADERMVMPRGDGMMTGTGSRILSAAEVQLKSGGVEGSNVEPIVETTALIDILRSYQVSQQMSQSLDDLRHDAIQRLGRLS
ncbi:flagellar hook-basal body complex protein [Sphingomonas sp. RIT328]|uniref:flagellar hook-basal body complex protein n=1 Tax=Sphingomonas sp. RIT328 TaxID=1470591 RepID=UPI0004523DAE|nr:flagellar hook-basal body complex protein [Sphingomonas sp. RIT328]EZP48675.1 Flagellar basal-body rod protein FlgF [Sphingomonas sp. RIT328]